MIHIIFSRPEKTLKVFDADHALRFVYEASGAACQNTNGPMPGGHYVLLEPELFPQATWDSSKLSEGVGWGRIRIRDMSVSDAQLLTNAGLATKAADAELSVGGVILPPGQCNSYQRVIEVHGGGSALGMDSYLPNQQLCCTEGCTRMHNQDLKALVRFMQPLTDQNTFVFSVIGTPAPCNC
jgi:hypothetical protein